MQTRYQLISPISYIYYVSQEKRAEPFSFAKEKNDLTFFVMKKKIMLVSFGAGHSPAFGTWFIPYLNDSSVLSEARSVFWKKKRGQIEPLQCCSHVTGTGSGLLGGIPRVVVQISALTLKGPL
jgi:hypothetical protein